MLLFTALATLLCSPLVVALEARVDSPDALKQCQSQPYCSNPALVIKPDTFFPTIQASPPGEVKLRVAVESSEPLTFQVRVQSYPVMWEITPNTCKWLVKSDEFGLITFREVDDKKSVFTQCTGEVGKDVDIAIDTSETETSVELTGECNPPPGKLVLTCKYALPDSNSIPDWKIWKLSVSSSNNPDAASIMLKNAFVVYDAPPTTTTMASPNSTKEAGNATTTVPSNPGKGDGGTTPDVGIGKTTFYAVVGVCGLLFIVSVVAVPVAIIACIKLSKNKPRSPAKEGPRKKDGLDDRSKPIPLDGNGIVPEIAIIESKSKRLVDEKQVAAAEAQNPAPGEAPGEPNGQDVVNKGPDGTSTQPAAYPTSI